MKKTRTFFLTALLLAGLLVFSGCGSIIPDEEYPGLEKLVELTETIATKYNQVAETAINNGWEYDDGTVSRFDEIAELIEKINAGVTDPSSFEEGQIEELTKSIKESGDTLKELEKTVSQKYEIEGMTINPGK